MSSNRSLVFSEIIAAVIANALVSRIVAIGVLNTAESTYFSSLRNNSLTTSVQAVARKVVSVHS